MKIKKLLILTTLSLLCVSVNAQTKDNTPKKGDFTVATSLGYNSYIETPNTPAVPNSVSTSYFVPTYNSSWTDKKLMVGIEGGWFFQDRWKLNIGGGFNFSHNPGYNGAPGTLGLGSGGSTTVLPDDDYSDMGNLGEVPTINAVAKSQTMLYNAFVGVDRYFSVKGVPNLMWYAGLRAGISYAQLQSKANTEFSMGKYVSEFYNIRGAATMGIEYYFLPGMYAGIQVDPLAYSYSVAKINPEAGLGTYGTGSHNIDFLSAPTIKIGFKF